MSVGTHTDQRKGLRHLSLDKSDAKGLEEKVDGNESCHVTVTNYLQVVVGASGRHGEFTPCIKKRPLQKRYL